MAKAIIEGLDEAIEEIYKDYKRAIKLAAIEATEKTKDDIYANTVSCLVAYYDDYEPSSYDRTYTLLDSFVPYSKGVQEAGDELICIAGVEFDPARIQGLYHGSSTYSDTDAEWILSNFLNGIHPRTDGSQVLGGGNYEQEKYQGIFVPESEMQRYLDEYTNTFDRNFRRSLSKQILRLIKK